MSTQIWEERERVSNVDEEINADKNTARVMMGIVQNKRHALLACGHVVFGQRSIYFLHSAPGAQATNLVYAWHQPPPIAIALEPL